MRRFNIAPDIRISLGLVLFTMTLLMGLDMVGVLPDPNKAVLDLRKKTCESLSGLCVARRSKGRSECDSDDLGILEEKEQRHSLCGASQELRRCCGKSGRSRAQLAQQQRRNVNPDQRSSADHQRRCTLGNIRGEFQGRACQPAFIPLGQTDRQTAGARRPARFSGLLPADEENASSPRPVRRRAGKGQGCAWTVLSKGWF